MTYWFSKTSIWKAEVRPTVFLWNLHLTSKSLFQEEHQMRKLAVFVSVALFSVVIANAQSEAPKATVYGGYSYLRNSGNGSNGWNGQATFNLNRYFGLTADFAGNYRNVASFSPVPGFSASANQHLYTYLFGPTVTGQFGNSAIFAHALFGAAHSSSSAGISLPLVGGIS